MLQYINLFVFVRRMMRNYATQWVTWLTDCDCCHHSCSSCQCQPCCVNVNWLPPANCWCHVCCTRWTVYWTLAIFGLHLWCVNMTLAGTISAVWTHCLLWFCWRDLLLELWTWLWCLHLACIISKFINLLVLVPTWFFSCSLLFSYLCDIFLIS